MSKLTGGGQGDEPFGNDKEFLSRQKGLQVGINVDRSFLKECFNSGQYGIFEHRATQVTLSTLILNEFIF